LLAALTVFVVLSSALAGLLGSSRPIWIGPGAAGALLAGLLSHLSHPALAWPAADRSRLPSTTELQIALILSLVIVASAAVLAARLALRIGGAQRHERAARWAGRGDLASLRVRRSAQGRITLGHHRGALIAAEERASVMVVGPTQSGKTTGLVVPAMGEWSGPVLATSIKTDVLHDTLAVRSEHGEIRVFDPTGATTIGHASWSPLSASTGWTGARRTAAALLGVGDHGIARSADDAFWRPAGARYLAALLYAAAQSPELTMADVLHWIATTEFGEPARLLEGVDAHASASPALDAIQSVKSADQRFLSSLLQTIATALDPWLEPKVAGATMGESKISADWLLGAANTLYLIAPAHEQRRLRGLFTALVAHVVAGAYERSARSGRPIEPALLLALDEVCNIAPLPNLDEIASTGPGQGVHLLCVLQNISQAYDRWGRDRAETIVANHRARLFCSGIGDRATLDYLRGTLGDEEIERISTQRRGLVPGGSTHSTEHRPLAAPHRVRQAARSQSLLVYGRLAPAWITLRSSRAASRRASGSAERRADGKRPGTARREPSSSRNGSGTR
jgi:type IV secretion system protein VirD4